MSGRFPPASAATSARDQAETAFTTILRFLLTRVREARAVALVDIQGETVDYVGRLEPYQIRVLAAHWRIVLADASRSATSPVRWIGARASRAAYLIHALPEGYALALRMVRTADLMPRSRAFAVCADGLAREAGWPAAALPFGRAWFPAEVKCDERQRPTSIRLGEDEADVEILGSLASSSLAHGRHVYATESGWRVRLSTSGLETTLVREPSGDWYADEGSSSPNPILSPANPAGDGGSQKTR